MEFMFLKSIIYFQKREQSMSKMHLLCENYREWLGKARGRDCDRIVENFRSLFESLTTPGFKKDNKSIYPSLHANFLSHLITSRPAHLNHAFPFIVTMLNYILKNDSSIGILMNSSLLQAIRDYFRQNRQAMRSEALVSSVLWLICKCLQGMGRKKAVLEELARNGLVYELLHQGELDAVGERAISMLLYYIGKNQRSKLFIAKLVLTHLHRFTQIVSVKHMIALLEEAGVQMYQKDQEAIGMLQKFLVRYMKMEGITLSEKMQHISLIICAVQKNPSLAESMRIGDIIECKLSISSLPQQPKMDQLIKLIQLQVIEATLMKKYLDMAVSTLTNNIVSRRMFILFHDKMTEEQLIAVLSQGLPSSLLRLMSSDRQMENCLKLLICLKRSVNRLGLSRIFWYACKPLIERVLSCNPASLPQTTLELLQLFQDIMREEIEVIKQI